MTTHKYFMDKYLEKFKKKHGFTDEDCNRFSDRDIIYDIDLDMPADTLQQWEDYCKEHGYISFVEWTGVDNGYTPVVDERSGMEDLKDELGVIYRNIEKTFENAFKDFYDDEWEDSESEYFMDIDSEE